MMSTGTDAIANHHRIDLASATPRREIDNGSNAARVRPIRERTPASAVRDPVV